jgi:hypothetical protein
MYRQKELPDAVNNYTPRAWLALAGVSAIILSAAGVAQGAKLTDAGTAILDAGNGSVVVNGNGITSGCINWYNGGSPPPCPSASTGTLTVDAGSTSPFTVGATGTIQNLSFDTVYPVVDFISIGGLDFDLLDIRFNGDTAIGDCTVASGDTTSDASCTPANSPFTLTNGTAGANGNVDTVSIDFTVDAIGYTGSSSTGYDSYIGIFSTQQAVQGMNIQDILSTIGSGGSVSASWSATFEPITEIPEPESFLLLGAGLTAIGLYKRNARKS